MSKLAAEAAPRTSLNIRVSREVRALIDHAAALTGRSRTDFLLEAGQRAAEEALLDRTLFHTDEKTFAAFQHALDEPPKPNAALRKTMRAKAPWDE